MFFYFVVKVFRFVLVKFSTSPATFFSFSTHSSTCSSSFSNGYFGRFAFRMQVLLQVLSTSSVFVLFLFSIKLRAIFASVCQCSYVYVSVCVSMCDCLWDCMSIWVLSLFVGAQLNVLAVSYVFLLGVKTLYTHSHTHTCTARLLLLYLNVAYALIVSLLYI